MENPITSLEITTYQPCQLPCMQKIDCLNLCSQELAFLCQYWKPTLPQVFICACVQEKEGSRRRETEREDKQNISTSLHLSYPPEIKNSPCGDEWMCTYLCVHMSKCVCTCVHAYRYKSFVLKFFFYSSYLLRQGLSLNLKFLGIVTLDDQQTLRILYLLPRAENAGTCCYAWNLTGVQRT